MNGGKISPKESDKTAGPLGTRVFTVHRRFCRYFLTPTKQITTKLVFVVSDHYSFVVISVFCRLYLHHYRTSGKKTRAFKHQLLPCRKK